MKGARKYVRGRLGLSPTEAMTLFYEQIVRERSVSFAVAMPNATTRLAIRDAEVGRKLIRARSAVALIAALDSDD